MCGKDSLKKMKMASVLGQAGLGLIIKKNYSIVNIFNKILATKILTSHKFDLLLTLPKKCYCTESLLDKKINPNSEDEDWSKIGSSREKIEIDGISLNWDQAGSGEHVVLLLPGILGSIQLGFGPIFKQMNKEKFTLVSWDPPGYGRSRPPDRDFNGTFYQRDGELVVKLMDKLGHNKYSILGWSNGGITGGHIAADHPDRVLKLVTWGAHSFLDEKTVMFTKMMGDLNLWPPTTLKHTLELYGREYLLQMLQDWHQGVTDFHNQGLDQNFKDAMTRINCPVFVLHGEHDPVIGVEHAEFIRDNVKNCRMYVMPNAKHNVHLKFTNEFLELVENFLLE